jgi:hypothetical protein
MATSFDMCGTSFFVTIRSPKLPVKVDFPQLCRYVIVPLGVLLHFKLERREIAERRVQRDGIVVRDPGRELRRDARRAHLRIAPSNALQYPIRDHA